MPSVATIPVNPTIGQRLAGLDQGQRLRLALGVLLFVAIGVVGLVMGRQAEWRVLYSNLADKDEKTEKAEQQEQTWQAVRGRQHHPDVELSTFQNWGELGDWYRKLQSDRVQPAAEVKAKAAALTQGMTDDDANIRALYDFVSTKYRYIGIVFGIGRYQPHSSAEVLANQYGDCKDKHTLFASLLAASGIRAYPALISST